MTIIAFMRALSFFSMVLAIEEGGLGFVRPPHKPSAITGLYTVRLLLWLPGGWMPRLIGAKKPVFYGGFVS